MLEILQGQRSQLDVFFAAQQRFGLLALLAGMNATDG